MNRKLRDGISIAAVVVGLIGPVLSYWGARMGARTSMDVLAATQEAELRADTLDRRYASYSGYSAANEKLSIAIYDYYTYLNQNRPDFAGSVVDASYLELWNEVEAKQDEVKVLTSISLSAPGSLSSSVVYSQLALFRLVDYLSSTHYYVTRASVDYELYPWQAVWDSYLVTLDARACLVTDMAYDLGLGQRTLTTQVVTGEVEAPSSPEILPETAVRNSQCPVNDEDMVEIPPVPLK
jgi:hypothetical protein